MSRFGGVIMAKQPSDEIKRYELKARASWFREAEKQAKALGLSVAAYIRMAVIDDIARRKQKDK